MNKDDEIIYSKEVNEEIYIDKYNPHDVYFYNTKTNKKRYFTTNDEVRIITAFEKYSYKTPEHFSKELNIPVKIVKNLFEQLEKEKRVKSECIDFF